jgi:PmbA protein
MSTTKESLIDLSKKLESRCQEVMTYAKDRGAARSKLIASATFEQRLTIENKEFTLANSLESQKIGLLVHKDQKKGSASLNNMNLDSLKTSVDDALSLARFSVADEYLTMPTSREAPRAKELPFLFQDALAEKDLNHLQEFAQRLLAELTKDSRLAIDKCELHLSTSWHGLYNSEGVSQNEKQTAVGWSFMGMAVDGEEVSGMDYDGRHCYKWDGALDLALEDARKFADRVLATLRPGKSPSYKGVVLLSPRAVEEILLGTIFYHASGSSVMDGKSKWDKAIDSQVVHPLMTLIDRPHDPMFTGATAFDGDGLPTRDHCIVEAGRLKMHLHDCYSAKRTGKTSTATSGGPFALTMNAGSDELASMRTARNELLVVDRFSGNIDPIKGDFSGVAKSSRLIRNGQDAGPVTETMIAGNLFDVLSNIQMVSKSQELVSGSILLPWVLASHISVSGN